MSKECEKYEDLIEAFVAGELDELTTAEVKEHIDRCSSCRRKYEIAVKIEKFLTPEEAVVPPGFARAVASKIASEASRRIPQYAPPEWSILAGWFIALVGVLLGALQLFHPSAFEIAKKIIQPLLSNPIWFVAGIVLLLGGMVSAAVSAVLGFMLLRKTA